MQDAYYVDVIAPFTAHVGPFNSYSNAQEFCMNTILKADFEATQLLTSSQASNPIMPADFTKRLLG